MEQLNSLILLLKEKYNQQGQPVKVLLPGVFLLLLCCLCLLIFRLIPAGARNTPASTASPIVVLTIERTLPTPTALFGFDATLFPTLVAPSPLPTTHAPPTATLIPTQTIPAPTATPLPTSTNPPQTASSSGSVEIIAVNKPEEYVDLQNTGNGLVELSGWQLVSETGNQPCTLSGILQPNEVVRVWARLGTTGLSCNYAFNIWNDDQSDPAVLYDAQGEEVSRYP